MQTFHEVYAALRRKNSAQYRLLTNCCFFSVLLITAYVTMMRSPTILNVLPEGGDSRKQVMMIFVLACVGCAVFTTYASAIFFRQKSREIGVFLLLGATRKQICKLLFADLARIAAISCLSGALLGAPLAWGIWFLFRLFVVDSEEMPLTFDSQAYLFALVFSIFVVVMLFGMGTRFIRRTNIIDVVNTSHKTEPIREVKAWYGSVGIFLMGVGGLLGYLMPSFFVLVLHWYAPGWIGGIFYVPLFIGLYMVLLHTVVNGFQKGKSRYRHLISTAMMKFQGRQTVRNMLVITVLLAGAYFGLFYTPMLGTGAIIEFAQRPIDYAFHYRNDQTNMIQRAEIEQLAKEENVQITSWTQAQIAELGVDGTTQVERETALGVTYETLYVEMLASTGFMSESAYEALTGQDAVVEKGHVKTVVDDNGGTRWRTDPNITRVENLVTGQVLHVEPDIDSPLQYSMLIGYYVLNDEDYAAISKGLLPDWQETMVFFNVADSDASYPFAKRLFDEIVDRSGPEVEQYDAFNYGAQIYAQSQGETYYYARENLKAAGLQHIDYAERDSSEFRLYWKYMPQFRVFDQNDFVRTTAVFLMLFIFIAIICFAAVIIIAYTRCITIAMGNIELYEDLRRLGASRAYLLETVRGQVSRIFFMPCLVGTLGILALYIMILYFNDNTLSFHEIAGLGVSGILVLAVSALLYGVYRISRRKVCEILGV